MLDLQPNDRLSYGNAIVDDQTAAQALLGLYSSLNIQGNYGIRKILVPGVLSDELINLNNNQTYFELDQNEATSINLHLNDIWTASYQSILRANLLLEILPTTATVDPALKSEIVAHAKFVRGLMHFELLRYFGDVPIVLSSDLNEIQSEQRQPANEVFDQVLLDLKDAEASLPKTISTRALAVSSTATALLARVHMYRNSPGDMEEVILNSTKVINNIDYQMEGNYADVFKGESIEVIFEVNASFSRLALESRPGSQFNYSGSPEWVSSFEAGDLRRTFLAQSDANGLFYSDKYLTNTSNPVILRLPEMYLLRAEALAKRNEVGDLDAAQVDLSYSRVRAGLVAISGLASSSQVLEAIEAERFIELAYEGHRFFDLVRTNRANTILGARNPSTWQETDQLMPIPFTEVNFGLGQNPGYN